MFWEGLIAYFPLTRRGSHKNDASNNSPIFACVFISAVSFLLNQRLTTRGGYTCRHTDGQKGFTKYAVEMGSGAMIRLPSFRKIGSDIQKLIKGDS
jgi:hypothetical protein